ncbi:MAG: hypothetical protein OXF68_08395 [Gammaproteobacteria bacterium]|nr:hypothetical protein [Gammaproteobacteria bacterium]
MSTTLPANTSSVDTAAEVEALLAADVPERQARAIVRMAVRIQDGLVTKSHLDATLEAKLATLKHQIVVTLVGAMVGVAGLALAIGQSMFR